ncbi:MAG: hypothetical protein M3N45_05165 [Actinomycetota bacterium]|nr:hypothetical protein [Actinomycetota bacterium]
MSSLENPYASNVLGPSDHEPAGRALTYESMEAMWAAPQGNVRETSNTLG